MNYGLHGIGKSTWANQPGVKFFDVENGLGDIDLYLEPWKVRDYGDLMSGISWICANPGGINAIAIDTIDALERAIWSDVAKEAKKSSIEEIPYGKGYEIAVSKWMEVLRALTYLSDNFQIAWILLGHCKIVKMKPPGSDSYDQYQPDIHHTASSLLSEYCTEVLFSGYKTFTRSEDLGFNKTRAIAVGGEDRFILTTHTATADAKNRLNLPKELPFDFWGTESNPGFGRFLPKPAVKEEPKPAAVELPDGPPVSTPISMNDVFAGSGVGGDIDGIVNNGSSKQAV